MKYTDKIPQRQITHWIGKLGYEIIDEIIAPECGISEVFADLYLACIMDYAEDTDQADKIVKQIRKRYKIKETDVVIFDSMPIALIALAILEGGVYK